MLSGQHAACSGQPASPSAAEAQSRRPHGCCSTDDERMDAVGCRRVLCPPCGGRVPHRLAEWALETLGIAMPTPLFLFANTMLVIAALALARIGWRRPAASLVIPAAAFINAVFFHILPTIVQHRVAPGVVTAVLLYVPFSTWAYVGAWRDGVPSRALM